VGPSISSSRLAPSDAVFAKLRSISVEEAASPVNDGFSGAGSLTLARIDLPFPFATIASHSPSPIQPDHFTVAPELQQSCYTKQQI